MHSRIAIPDYSLAEELISAISHGIGTGLAIAGCVLCIVKAVCDRVGAAGIVSAAIFGAAMIFLYCMSTLYHSITAKASAVINLLMGWLVVISYKGLASAVSPRGIALLLIGGVVYTVGVVFYSLGSNVRYMHSIWHFFVLGGTICHFFAIYLGVL